MTAANAVLGRHVEAIAEREERIGGHDRAVHLELLVRRLHCGDAGRIHAAHLAGADADGRALPRANTIAFDFTNLQTRQANSRSASSAAVGLRCVTTLSVGLARRRR